MKLFRLEPSVELGMFPLREHSREWPKWKTGGQCSRSLNTPKCGRHPCGKLLTRNRIRHLANSSQVVFNGRIGLLRTQNLRKRSTSDILDRGLRWAR